MSNKKRTYDRVKFIKGMSRIINRNYGKSGIHDDKRERRVKRPSTEDYLDEMEEEIKPEETEEKNE